MQCLHDVYFPITKIHIAVDLFVPPLMLVLS